MGIKKVIRSRGQFYGQFNKLATGILPGVTVRLPATPEDGFLRNPHADANIAKKNNQRKSVRQTNKKN